MTRPDVRRFMASHPSGVAVVAAMDSCGAPRGMTCSSLISVTIDPPILLVSLRTGSPTLDAVERVGRFTVNLLHADAKATAELFASGEPRRYDAIPWVVPDGAAGPHLVAAAHGVADCRVADAKVVGDHTLILGRVVRLWEYGDPRPLLYGLHRYASWSAHRSDL